MSGALSQLKLNKTGVDKYIIGNPQITFFKSVFRRYTNFAIDSRAIPFIGGINFGQESHVTIPGQGGDLLYKLYLQITLPKITCKMSSETEFTALEVNSLLCHYSKDVKFRKDFPRFKQEKLGTMVVLCLNK